MGRNSLCNWVAYKPLGMVGLDIYVPNGAFTLDVKSMLNEDLGGILGGTQC